MLSGKKFALAVASVFLAGAAVKAYCDSGSSGAIGASTQSTIPIIAADRAPMDDVAAGEAALKAGELDLARLHLLKVIANDPANTRAITAFVPTAIARAQSFARQDDHQMAATALREGREALAQVTQSLLRPAQSSDGAAILVEVDQKLTHAESELRMDAERKCFERIQRADMRRDEAHYGWYTLQSNDRGKVLAAMRELRYVDERYALVGNWLQGEFHRAMSQQKALVSDKEWDDMMASAGFVKHDGQ